jgi:hypothetical protein
LIPLPRDQTGDVARLLVRDQVALTARRHDVTVPGVSAALLAFEGRDREALPNGSHVGVHKDALYTNPQLARQVTAPFA